MESSCALSLDINSVLSILNLPRSVDGSALHAVKKEADETHKPPTLDIASVLSIMQKTNRAAGRQRACAPLVAPPNPNAVNAQTEPTASIESVLSIVQAKKSDETREAKPQATQGSISEYSTAKLEDAECVDWRCMLELVQKKALTILGFPRAQAASQPQARIIRSFVKSAQRLHPEILPAVLKTQFLSIDSISPASTLSASSLQELEWWVKESHLWLRSTHPFAPEPPYEVFTDASRLGWGAVLYPGEMTARGDFPRITDGQLGDHVTSNWRELHAIGQALSVFHSHFFNCSRPSLHDPFTSVLVRTDNVTAASYINKHGGSAVHLVQECHDILMGAWRRRLLLKAVHVKGKKNVLADRLSRFVLNP